MLESRQILNARLEHQLGTLVSSVEIAIRANLASSNAAAENTLMELLNRVYGWNLVNANSISQNYAGVDLIDEARQIAVQVTSTRTPEKVRHTLAEVSVRDIPFQRVIVLFISNRAATQTIKNCAGTMELWNIPDVFRDAIALDTDRLREIIALMDKELGTIRGILEEMPHLELPLGSCLESSGFVGREEELAEIRSRFVAGDKVVVLTGLGGIGKTELAVQYGRKHSNMVYFTRFDNSFTRALASMAHGIRPKLSEDALRQDECVLRDMVLQLLKKSEPLDLLIIDNVDSETKTLADLQNDPGYVALTELPLQLLMTTRSYSPRSIEIFTMSDNDLIEIFRNHGTDLSNREMIELIRAVNGHTMTIDLIARTLNGRDWRTVTAAELLSALSEKTLPFQKYQEVVTDYKQSPKQAQIYTHLSVLFDVSGIPAAGKTVLRCAVLLPEGGMNARWFGSAFSEGEQEALDILLNRGWLEIRNGLMTIHPVIRLVCQTETPPTDADCISFLEALAQQFDKYSFSMVLYRQMAELLTNASRFLQQSQCRCALEAGEIWRNVGDYVQALACDNRAKDIMERTLSPDDPALALIYNNIGCTYHYLCDYRQALTYHQKALDIRKRVLPANDPALALSYDNTGSIYNNLCEPGKALEYQQKALAIMESALPPGHPELAEYYSSVGFTYSELNKHSRALGYYRKALAIAENALSPDHPHLANYYNNVGYSHGMLGDHARAMEYQWKALAIRERVLLPNHPDIACSCSNIAWLCHAAGDLWEAARYMRRAAQIIACTSLPKTHPNQINYPNWADQFEWEANMQHTSIP